MKLKNIKASAIRAIAKRHGKRVSKEFLQALDTYIETKVNLASLEHNGGRKTIDSALAAYFLGNK